MGERKNIVCDINRLILDPNNYRFIDRPDYVKVEEQHAVEERIQLRAFNFILGKNAEHVQDLIASFKTNGFLNLDLIQVKRVGDYYLVLEGNRRTATLKYLYEEYKRGNDVGLLTPDDFHQIEVVELSNQQDKEHLITMGLNHIGGKKRWSPLNQARLIRDLVVRESMHEDEVCRSLGLTKTFVRRTLRALALIERYLDSDYGDQFNTRNYALFEEIGKNPNIKSWLEWDDGAKLSRNSLNEERIFTWISKIEEIDEEDDDNIITYNPIITRSRDIRELSKYILDEKAVRHMEETRSISEGFLFSDVVGEARLKSALNSVQRDVQLVGNFSSYMASADFEELEKVKNRLEDLLPNNEGYISLNEKEILAHFENVSSHFDSVDIKTYRKLKNLRLNKLSRVNLFAGNNNVGKTTILESIFLLTKLNDINSVIDLEKNRGKFIGDIHAKWMDRNFITGVWAESTFNSVPVNVKIIKRETDDEIDKTQYLSTLMSNASVGGQLMQSHIHLFENKEPKLFYQKVSTLCRSAFSSPFRQNHRMLKRAHASAVREKYFHGIVDFLKKNVDSSVENIELVNIEGESRFIVNSSKHSEGIDLTRYGVGMQRVFEIALLMGYCRNGVLFIDELDSAIHKGLLVKFTKYIQMLAVEFNVQVFVTTHSKECIDAFISNEFKNEDIIAYALTDDESGSVVGKYITGDRLGRLIEAIDLDIR